MFATSATAYPLLSRLFIPVPAHAWPIFAGVLALALFGGPLLLRLWRSRRPFPELKEPPGAREIARLRRTWRR